MEGDQYHNPDKVAVVTAEGQPTPLNEAPAKAPSTETAGDPEPPYTPLGVWVKEMRYYNESHMEYNLMHTNEEDRHSPKISLPRNAELSFRALMVLFLVGQLHSVRTSEQSPTWSDLLPANFLVECGVIQPWLSIVFEIPEFKSAPNLRGVFNLPVVNLS